jgi:ribonuclease VapC
LFRSEKGATKMQALLQQAAAGEIKLVMTVVNLAEVIYRTIRGHSRETAVQVLGRILDFNIDLIEVDRALALRAALLKGSYRISYADCLAAALAQQLAATVVTGDKDFEKLADHVSVEWLSG